MGPYPVVLDLGGRPVLVVGGGAVAERKVEGLRAAGASITVVSPRVSARLAEMADDGNIIVRLRSYRRSDLRGVVVVFAATDDRDVNAAVAADSRRRRIWVNAVDDPDHCDFILPSVLRRGSLLVSVTTGGRSPALARIVREELERLLGSDYALLTDLAGDVRRELRTRGEQATAEAWTTALRGDVRRLVAAGRREEARRCLLEALRPA
jgi:precorrin-2 dehydrogenase/sirohydrochlorin ferrochelatase